MSRRYQYLISVLTFLILLTSVSAKTDVTNQFNEQGLIVEFPDFPTGQVSTAFEFPFHVYNASSGEAVNTSTFCVLHVYNAMGEHLLIGYQDNVTHGYDYEFAIPNTTFTSVGMYRFNIYCEYQGIIGGFVTHAFEITNSGYDGSDNYMAIALILTCLMFIFVLNKLSVSLSSHHYVFKLSALILSFIFAVMTLHFAYILLQNSTFISASLEYGRTILSVANWCMYFLFAYISFYYTYEIFMWINNKIIKK